MQAVLCFIHFWQLSKLTLLVLNCFCKLGVKNKVILANQINRAGNTLSMTRTDSHEIIYPI